MVEVIAPDWKGSIVLDGSTVNFGIADKCANQIIGFGKEGANANAQIGIYNYRIPPIWDNTKGVCSNGHITPLGDGTLPKYRLRSALNTDYCVSQTGKSSSDNNALTLLPCENSVQSYQWFYSSGDLLKSVNGDKCVIFGPNNKIIQVNCANVDPLTLTLVGHRFDGTVSFYYWTKASGTLYSQVTATNPPTLGATNVWSWYSEQKYKLEIIPNAPPEFAIKSRASANVCIDQAAWDTTVGKNLGTWDCNYGNNQRFSFVGASLVIKSGQLCVDSYKGAWNGANVIQNTCTSGPFQQLVYLADDETLRPKYYLGYCIQYSTNGLLYLKTCDGSINQKWTLIATVSP